MKFDVIKNRKGEQILKIIGFNENSGSNNCIDLYGKENDDEE